MTCERNEISLLEASELLNRGITPSYTEDLVNGVLVLNQKCIRDQKVSFEQARLTDKNKKKINHEKYLLDYDILINSTGVGTLGRVAQIKRVNQPTTVDSHVTILRPNPTIVNPEYLGYVVKNIQPVLESMAEGTTGQTELSRERVGKIKFDLPTQPYQIKVVKILSTIDKRIDLLKETNKTLESIAEAIFKSWFVDFDPVHAKQQGVECAGIDKTTADLFPNSFIETELGVIPKGWNIVKLGSILQTVLGGTPSKNNEDYWLNGNIPWVNSGAVNKFRITTPTALITELGLNKSSTKIMPKRTTLLAITGATLGQISLTEFECCANQSVIGIIGNDNLPNEYVYLWMKENVNELLNRQTGGAQQHVNKNDVNDLNILMPTLSIIECFYKLNNQFFNAIANNCFQIITLEKLRDNLLPRLITGKLDLGNIEEELEGIT